MQKKNTFILRVGQQKMTYSYTYGTVIGAVTIIADDDAVISVRFGTQSGFAEKETPLIKFAYGELCLYLCGRLKEFSVLLRPEGSVFRMSVWRVVSDIPYGETRSYAEVAAASGHRGAYRAVGSANNKNPLPLFIPCHRVIGSDGKLIGYAGGLEKKRYLLELEKKFIDR